MPEIEVATPQLVVRFSDHSANEAAISHIYLLIYYNYYYYYYYYVRTSPQFNKKQSIKYKCIRDFLQIYRKKLNI